MSKFSEFDFPDSEVDFPDALNDEFFQRILGEKNMFLSNVEIKK